MAIFTTRKVAFATGTGTNETAEQDVPVPANAVELIATQGDVHVTQGDPAESIIGVFRLKGDNWQNNPYEWFSEIGSAKLGAIDQVAYDGEPRWWKANLPVKSNSTIKLTYEPLDALANNGMASAKFRWSSTRTGLPPTKRKCSREVATSTLTDASITLTDLGVVTALIFGVTATTVAADDPGDYSLSVECSALAEQQTIQSSTVIHSIEATTGIAKTALRYDPQDIPAKSANATFNATLTETTALGTAGTWFYAIEYIPTTVQV